MWVQTPRLGVAIYCCILFFIYFDLMWCDALFHGFLFPFMTINFFRIRVTAYYQASLSYLAHGYKHMKAINFCWIKLHWHIRKSWTQSRENGVNLVTFWPLIMCEVITDMPSIRPDLQLGFCLQDGWQGRSELSWLAHVGLQPMTLASLTQQSDQLSFTQPYVHPHLHFWPEKQHHEVPLFLCNHN